MMRVVPGACRQPHRLLRSRRDASQPDARAAAAAIPAFQQRRLFYEARRASLRRQTEALAAAESVTPPPTPSRRPLGMEFGGVRREWRGYLEKLQKFPRLQQCMLEAASFLTSPRDLEFGLPRDFHAKYSLGTKLGEGAFGEVFCVVPLGSAPAADIALDLAVKVVPKARVVNHTDYAALRQEGRMMVLLGGTLNVVHFFGAYEDDENVYLVMERCMGGDALARLENEQQSTESATTEARARLYMGDILHVVWQCHLLRILHGDLKLENFLFADTAPDSPLKLTDFGGASFLLQDDQRLYEVRGTPLYTAPEVLARREGYGFPSDLWSCGVVLYRLLSGHFPFEADALLDERIQHEAVDLESTPWPSVSTEAKDLVRQLLERDPSKRLTAEQALQHPWLVSSATATTSTSTTAAAAQEAAKGVTGPALQGSLVQRLQLYRSLNLLQHAVLNEVARQLPLELKQDVLVLFSEVSRDGRAAVGLAELAAYVSAGGYRLTRGEVKGFLSDLDLDGDGRLSQDEFCAALLDWSRLQAQQEEAFTAAVRRVFEALDGDDDGHVTREDFMQLDVLRVPSPRTTHSFRHDLARCLQFADLSGSGRLDVDEFLAMLRIRPDAYRHFATRLRLR